MYSGAGMSSRRAPLVPILLSACLSCGCGATTLRVSGGPTLDTSSRVGFEVLGSIGLGMPLDYKGRSRHFLQGRGVLGGGMDAPSRQDLFVAGLEADYIYWPDAPVDLRVGLQGMFRRLPNVTSDNEGGSFGGHVAVVALPYQDGSSWLVTQLAIGPEVRIEYVGMSAASESRAQFSIPLVVEVNLLAAGD